MKKPLYIVILQTDGGIRLQALESGDEPTLEQLQTYVGGNFQTVPAKSGVLLVNEEGKMYPLPLNINATLFLRPDVIDIIFGDAVLCRIEGERFAGFPLHLAARIADSLHEAVTV